MDIPSIHATTWQFHGSTTGSTPQLSVCAALSICACVQPYLSHTCVCPNVLLAYPPVVFRGGGGSLEGPARGKKAILGVKMVFGFGAAEAHWGGGLALTRRTGGVGADEEHGGGFGADGIWR